MPERSAPTAATNSSSASTSATSVNISPIAYAARFELPRASSASAVAIAALASLIEDGPQHVSSLQWRYGSGRATDAIDTTARAAQIEARRGIGRCWRVVAAWTTSDDDIACRGSALATGYGDPPE